jgi:iron complex transport system substrate-binding protein
MMIGGADNIRNLLIILLGVWVGVSACETKKADRSKESKVEQKLASSSPEIVAETHNLPSEAPQRIISLAPNITEILYALDLGDSVVAVTKHSDFPAAANQQPSIGSGLNPNLEAIVSHTPDLIVGVETASNDEVIKAFKDAGLGFVFLELDTIEQVVDGMEVVGRLTGKPEKGDRASRHLGMQLERLRHRYGSKSSPEVLMVHGHSPLIAAGPGTFGHQLIEYAGAENALAGSSSQLPKLDVEKVLSIDPDVIIDTSTRQLNRDIKTFWNQYSGLTAVDENRVRIIRDQSLLRAGPRLPRALEKVHRAIFEVDDEEP